MKQASKRRTAPKKHRAIQTSRHLHVSHRRHTGHITPHRTTSYPVLAMILLLVGVLMYSWTTMAKAIDYGGGEDSYTVQTSVEGTAPTKPPTINHPNDGTNFTENPITVKGFCQPRTYLVLYRNGVFSGVANCSIDGTYSIQTDLFPGKNQLRVRVFSPTDQAGPFSNIMTVYYNPLHPADTDSDQANPLRLTAEFKYKGYYVGESSPWQLSINGGTTPYAIAVDWGDGQHELVSKTTAGAFNLQHTYKKAGGYRGGYVVTFSATDTKKSETLLQLLAIINNPGGVASTTGSIGGDTDGHAYDHFMKYIWSGYGVAVLMVVSFWLGERHEWELLRGRRRRHA